MSVIAKTELDQVEASGGAGEMLEFGQVVGECSVFVVGFDRHGVILHERAVVDETFSDHRVVAITTSGDSDAFVDLKEMDSRPVDLVVSGKGFEEHGRRRATRHGPHEPASAFDRVDGSTCDPRRSIIGGALGGGGATDPDCGGHLSVAASSGRRAGETHSRGPNCRVGSRGAASWSRERPRRCAMPPRPNPVGRTVEDHRRGHLR